MYIPSLTLVGSFLQQLLDAPVRHPNLCLVSNTMVALNSSTCAAAFAAVAVLTGNNNLTGKVTFLEGDDGVVQITGQISGLSPNAKHGFHIHEFGDISSGHDCLSTGGHFNPYKRQHGAPGDRNRHVGDLGNIETDANGVAKIDFTDKVLRLHGKRSIIGRGIVVHAGTDDLGRGNETDSKTTGHAGARAGCGVIGAANVTALNALN